MTASREQADCASDRSGATADEGDGSTRREVLARASTYDYELPESLIAARPASARSEARMLVAAPTESNDAELLDASIAALPGLLDAGDLIVFNDVRVVSARLSARRQTGGAIEVLVLGFGEEGAWDDASADLVAFCRPGRRLRPGESLDIVGYGPSADDDAMGTLLVRGRDDAGRFYLSLEPGGDAVEDAVAFLARAGHTPIPPYIERRRAALGLPAELPDDPERYQTVFAREPGAVAAPTASLHFDAALLDALDEAGVERAFVTLRVGAGTFRPVTSERLDDHEMHSEWFDVPRATSEAIRRTRDRGGRVVAVGTTVVRTLESAADDRGGVSAGSADTDLFIRPGYRFRVVDALVTNFHLPRSTLLALVSALLGFDATMQAYRHAVERRYRFFSYGDAMFIPRVAKDARRLA